MMFFPHESLPILIIFLRRAFLILKYLGTILDLFDKLLIILVIGIIYVSVQNYLKADEKQFSSQNMMALFGTKLRAVQHSIINSRTIKYRTVQYSIA